MEGAVRKGTDLVLGKGTVEVLRKGTGGRGKGGAVRLAATADGERGAPRTDALLQILQSGGRDDFIPGGVCTGHSGRLPRALGSLRRPWRRIGDRPPRSSPGRRPGETCLFLKDIGKRKWKRNKD